jgi:F0F1-type ATP synthase membrane subunit b/b'
VADDVVNRIGTILEQLSARFDLVLEAVSGFGGRLDSIRGEMVGQFAEVGRQVRFISDRIAENRETNAVTRADLGAEMVRLGEMLGATRVEFREQLGSIRQGLAQTAEASVASVREQVAAEVTRGTTTAHAQIKSEIAAAGEAMRKELTSARRDLGREIPAVAASVHEDISASSEALVKKIDAELKQTNKAVASLVRKFERFDDRLTVQARDQDQRLRKLERRTAAR